MIGVFADLSGDRIEERKLGDRSFSEINAANFDRVLAAYSPSVQADIAAVVNTSIASLPVTLQFKSMADFSPEAMAEQITGLPPVQAFGKAVSGDQLQGLWSIPQLQKLEASWRALHDLVTKVSTIPGVAVRVFHATKREFLRDLQKASEVNQSFLFKKLHDDVYGGTGDPFSLLVGEYETGHTPADLDFLERVSLLAEAIHAPFVTSAGADFFGQPDWPSLSRMPVREFDKALAATLGEERWRHWQRFRTSESAKYVVLTAPRVVVHTVTYGSQPEPFWGNTNFALAANVARAFGLYRWFSAIEGFQTGGLVEHLLAFTHTPQPFAPTGIDGDLWDVVLTNAGFVTMVPLPGSDRAVFFQIYSSYAPRAALPSAAASAERLSAKLSYVLTGARFAQYLKVMVRDAPSPVGSRAECEAMLNQWIGQYAGEGDFKNSQLPLAQASVHLEQVSPDQPAYEARVRLMPRFQYPEPVALVLKVILPVIKHTAANAPQQKGKIVAGRYELRGILGRGGMGEVYLAYDHRLTTEVALKRVPLELALEPAVREALVQEARILARLSDNHIVRLFDLADTADGLFLVLEYVCGPSLDKVLAQRKTLSTEELRHVVDQVAQGLTKAHTLGVIHRDLKPSNLLISLSGDDRRRFLREGILPPTLLTTEIKVTDFGLAKVVQQTRVEASGNISGTPAYMAPEQFRGELPSVETDVYALGFTAYVCLAGRLPLGDQQPVYFHLYVTPPPLAGVLPAIDVVIQKAIRKERAERYQSAAEFAAALRTALDSPAAQTAPSPQPLSEEYEKAESQQEPAFEKSRENHDKRSTLRWVAGAALSVLIFVFWAVDRFTAKTPVTDTSAQTAEQEAALPALPPLPPVNPPPRIDELPPVIESARVNAPLDQLPPGIEKPVILIHARITGNTPLGFGPDNTLYVMDGSGDVGAVRNGQLVWQYRLNHRVHFSIAPDGRIWFNDIYQTLYCFNAAGQGGAITDHAMVQRYLPVLDSINRATTGTARCVNAGEKQRNPAIEWDSSPGHAKWQTALDYSCVGDPVQGRGGKIFVQTESRTMYLLSGEGQVLWTYTAPCMVSGTTILADSTVVGRCENGKSLLGVRGGQQAFKIEFKSYILGPVGGDRNSNFYSLGSGDVYDQKFLIKTDSSGKDRWTLPLHMVLDPKITVGPDGKIYLLSSDTEGSSVLVIGDGQ